MNEAKNIYTDHGWLKMRPHSLRKTQVMGVLTVHRNFKKFKCRLGSMKFWENHAPKQPRCYIYIYMIYIYMIYMIYIYITNIYIVHIYFNNIFYSNLYLNKDSFCVQ